MSGKQKLELMWIGKEVRPRLETRVLCEDKSVSHFANSTNEQATKDNLLIHGDNLLAIKSIESDYSGKVKCIYIDPPYNTGNAFDQYDDGVEHSLWLSLMRERLVVLKRLLSSDGSIWINIDWQEGHYLKVLCDEIFGRKNFIAEVIWQKRTSRENRAAIGSSHDNILVYALMPAVEWKKHRNLLPPSDSSGSNVDNDPRGPWDSIPFTAQGYRPNQMYPITTPTGVKHDPPKGRCWGATESVYLQYLKEGRVYFPKSGDGKPRIKQFVEERGGLVPTSIWFGNEVGTTEESKKEMLDLYSDIEPFATPKPERLIQRILDIATNKGDIVLDSFAGSGTTGAVAHKMCRRWIMVELGEHCRTHIVPRLKKVINGENPGGITNAVNWKGGGGYRFYTLGPSLIAQDEWGRDIIAPAYRENSAMLIEAMCKLHGYTFKPSETHFWLHGQSTERDFIYVTTQSMTKDQVAAISNEVGPERTLLICCGSHRLNDPHQFHNITVEKIPKSVLEKCEWGKDDYSLKIRNLPVAEEVPEVIPEAERAEAAAESPKRKRGRPHKTTKSDHGQATIFDAADATETK